MDLARTATLAVLVALIPAIAHTQDTGGLAVELTAGRAAFLDDSPIHHDVVGGSLRYALTPRLSVGPELLWTRGPRDQGTTVVTANLTYDLLATPRARSRAVTPFLVAGGGVFRGRDRFNGAPFSYTEGALTGGGGLRVWIAQRLYVTGEVRTGWEPHLRGAVAVGWSFTR